MYKYFCCGSFENATSQIAPSPPVFFAMNTSFTNLPALVNTCSRLFTRSQTYTRLSTDKSEQCTGVRNCWAGGPSGLYGGRAVSSGLLPYAPQYRLNTPVSASITTTRLFR